MTTTWREELIWAAGLFEGEGCVVSAARKYPQITLNMTDEDSVRRFHRAVGVGKVRPRPKEQNPARAHWKQQWVWLASGFEQTQAVVAYLWLGLGERRRRRAAEVLAASPIPQWTRSKAFHMYGKRYSELSRTEHNDYHRRLRHERVS